MTESVNSQKPTFSDRKLVPERLKIADGPTRFGWEMAKIGERVALMQIDSNGKPKEIHLRVVGTLQVCPKILLVMFWGWAISADRDANLLLDHHSLQLLMENRKSDVDAIEFVCGIYHPSSSRDRGWIAPCDTMLPNLLDEFRKTWHPVIQP